MMRAPRIVLSILGALAAAAVYGACADPVHDAAVKALGPEIDGVPEGEYHRAGQPCGVCHEKAGPAKTVFSVAGTVFHGPNKLVGEGDVIVSMVDALGSSPTFPVTTNCVGNFYVRPEEWDPAFPVKVKLIKGLQTTPMISQISRDSSCGNCHKEPQGFDSPGHVHLTGNDTFTKPNDCPVDPELILPDQTTPASAPVTVSVGGGT